MIRYSRYIVAIVCILIIVFRLIFPNLNFDMISLSLLGIAALAILIQKPENIFKRTKRIKLGSFEVELQELNKVTESIEEEIIVKKEEPAGLSGSFTINSDVDYQLTNFHSIEFLKLSIEIEKTLRELYSVQFKSKEDRPLAVSKLIQILRDENVINYRTLDLLRRYWILRNKVIHDHSFEIDKKDAISFTDIGLRILKILRATKNNILDGKSPIYGIN